MNQNQLFVRTRWRLALWYAGVMAAILALSGVGVYEAIAHAHRITLERELESVAGTLHDSLEPVLKEPGRLEPAAARLLPDVCLVGVSCTVANASKRHTVGAINQGNYYLRLLDRSGKLVAIAGTQPDSLPLTTTEQIWQKIQDKQKNNYLQISLVLHTQTYEDWGYLQVGTSLQEVENYLATVQWIMLLGLPATMILVAVAAWCLAGLAMQPIYQSYRQIQQFTADAAHELRTPLAAIRATVESVLMMPNIPEAEAREILQAIARQNQRLAQMVADLLMLCRMDRQLTTNRFPYIQGTTVNLNDLVGDITEELAALALAFDVSLQSDIAGQQNLKVIGDAEQLYRLLSNLVVNGIQYTPSGGKVMVRLDSQYHWAVLQVQDTGIGIPVQEQKQIFDRFYRASSDRSRQTGGAGLGLAIAQVIVKAHQGSIELQSEANKGSIFTVKLPLKR